MSRPSSESRGLRDKAYLGDGAYVAHDGHGLWLTTEDGLLVTNAVYLEPEVYAALVAYVGRLRARTATEHDAETGP